MLSLKLVTLTLCYCVGQGLLSPISLLFSLVVLGSLSIIFVCYWGSVFSGLVFFLVYVGGLLMLLFYVVCLSSKQKQESGYSSISLVWVMVFLLLFFKNFKFSDKMTLLGFNTMFFNGQWLLTLFFSFLFFFGLLVLFKLKVFKKSSVRPFF